MRGTLGRCLRLHRFCRWNRKLAARMNAKKPPTLFRARSFDFGHWVKPPLNYAVACFTNEANASASKIASSESILRLMAMPLEESP